MYTEKHPFDATKTDHGNHQCTIPEIIDNIQHDRMKGSNNNTEVRISNLRYFIGPRNAKPNRNKNMSQKTRRKNNPKYFLHFNR